MTNNRLLNLLAEQLITNLNELTSDNSPDDFAEGEILAFVECLEMISLWKGFKKFKIDDIENRFHVK